MIKGNIHVKNFVMNKYILKFHVKNKKIINYINLKVFVLYVFNTIHVRFM